MKVNRIQIAAAALALTGSASAAVSVVDTYLTLDGVEKGGYTNPAAVDAGGPNPTTVNDGTTGTRRFGYRAKVTFTDATPASWSTSVSPGGWSFADIRNDHYFEGDTGNTGWGHASRWYLLDLTEATDLSISMASTLDDARPGFVIFGGESMNHQWGEAHSYSNNGVEMFRNAWDLNDTKLSYVTRGYNADGSNLKETIPLDAGLYTVVFGNIGSSTAATGTKEFNVIMSIPEPSTAVLGLLGGLLVFRRRR